MSDPLLDRYLTDLGPEHLPVAIKAASRYARKDPAPCDVLDDEYGEDGWPPGIASAVNLMGVARLEARTADRIHDVTDAQKDRLWKEVVDWGRGIKAAALTVGVKYTHAKLLMREMRKERSAA